MAVDSSVTMVEFDVQFTCKWCGSSDVTITNDGSIQVKCNVCPNNETLYV